MGDPHHEIRQACSDRGWVDVFFNETAGLLRERTWVSHPKGYFQPAVLAVHKSGRVLYRWRCVPKYSNMSGAGGRPEAEYTWGKIQKALEGSEDASFDKVPTMGGETVSWPLFLLVLTAHGWFLRPRPFPLAREGDTPSVNPEKMFPRIFGFVAFWLLLLIMLPIGWFGFALLAWLVVLAPGLIEIHRQFQNEPDDY